MTVHGAKGLEAPIVILADACAANERAERFLPIELPARRARCRSGCRARSSIAPRRRPGTSRRSGQSCARGSPPPLRRHDARARPSDRRGLPGQGQGTEGLLVRDGEPWPHRRDSPPGLVDLPARPGEEPVKRWRVSTARRAPRDLAPPRSRPCRKRAPRLAVPPGGARAGRDARRSVRRARSTRPMPQGPARRLRPWRIGRPCWPAASRMRFSNICRRFRPRAAPAPRRRWRAKLGGGLSPARRDAIVAEVQELISRSPAAPPLFSDGEPRRGERDGRDRERRRPVSTR